MKLTTRTTNTHRKFVGAFAKNTELKKEERKNAMFWLRSAVPHYYLIRHWVYRGWGPGHRHKRVIFNLEIGLIDFRSRHKSKAENGYFRTNG